MKIAVDVVPSSHPLLKTIMSLHVQVAQFFDQELHEMYSTINAKGK